MPIISKKIIITLLAVFLISIISGGFAFYKYLNYREQQKAEIKNTKAEDVTVTIIEGWNLRDIGEYLEKQKIISKSAFLKLVRNFNTLKYQSFFQDAKKSDLEGFLFPDTYRIPKPGSVFAKDGEAAANILIDKMLQNFENKYEAAIKNQTIPNYSTFQLITLASIVEKETGRNAVSDSQKQALFEERKIIAGIFYNRLKINMPLESDATINYISGKNDPSPLLLDLETNSPYNTYKNKGLPPGPICNPSLSSILAVLNPTPADYFYFLHKQPSGEPVYSKTYEEHLQNKQKYLK